MQHLMLVYDGAIAVFKETMQRFLDAPSLTSVGVSQFVNMVAVLQ